MCDVDNLERCEVWSEKPVLARKPRRCSNCRGPIMKGEAYLRHFDIFEGEPCTAALCYPCWLAREEFAEAHDQQLLHPLSVTEYIDECQAESETWREGLRWARLLRTMRRVRAARAALEGRER